MFENPVQEYQAEELHTGMRLDKALGLWAPDLSRSRLKTLIEEGAVTINGKICTRPATRLGPADRVSLAVPEPVPATPEPQDIKLAIVYEDDDLIVINKPAGLVVHPGAGNHDRTLVNALLHHCGDQLSGIGGVLRPGIVHRLDKDTSGLIIAAKNDKTHQSLSHQLEIRNLERRYKALVLGVPVPPLGTIDRPLGRHRVNRQKMSVTSRGGKAAVTHYKMIESYRDALALVECKLETGRTHQIRVHMQWQKTPVIGDPLYGPQVTALQAALNKNFGEEDTKDAVMALDRQFLHAYKLSFTHPGTEERLSFKADLPEDLDKVLNLLNK